MPEEFQEFEEQLDDIVNYSGLTLNDIYEICENLKKYYQNLTFEYTTQNIIDIIKYTAEIILSNRAYFDKDVNFNIKEGIKYLNVNEAIELAIQKVFPDKKDELDDSNNLNL